LKIESGKLKMRKQNNNNLKTVSNPSEMLDHIRWVPAQHMSRMSKITKMYFINEKLNQTSKLNPEKHSGPSVQNVQNDGLPVMLCRLDQRPASRVVK